MGGLGPSLVTEMVGLGCGECQHCLLVLSDPLAFENGSSISVWGEKGCLVPADAWQGLEAGRGYREGAAWNVPG